MIKTIFLTITATIAVVIFVASLFLNTILGIFGMAATSIETLQNLKTSQQVVDRMKTRQAPEETESIEEICQETAQANHHNCCRRRNCGHRRRCRDDDCFGGGRTTARKSANSRRMPISCMEPRLSLIMSNAMKMGKKTLRIG